MSIRLHRHPQFSELRDQFRAHPEWFRPWEGTVFRFQAVDFPRAQDVLSGKGAAWRGGRWNPPGLRAVYGSASDSIALEECKANDRYYGVLTKSPRLLVAIEARVTRMLDLTTPEVPRFLNMTIAELAVEDWRKLYAAGKETFTQALGRAAAASGGSGLLAVSAAVKGGTNIVIFPGVCGTDRLTVVEGDKLDKLARRRKDGVDTCNNAGYSAGKDMGAIAKKHRIGHPALGSFRFAHRGAKDYAGLLRHYRMAFKMPQPIVVRLTGFSPRSVAKWSEGVPPSPKQEKALVEMDRLLDALARVMHPQQVGHWLKSPNPAFDGSTPLQVVERGEMDRIWKMLYDLESGQPG